MPSSDVKVTPMQVWKSCNTFHLHIKNSITQTMHYNTFHFLRYVHFRYAKYLFINIQKQ